MTDNPNDPRVPDPPGDDQDLPPLDPIDPDEPTDEWVDAPDAHAHVHDPGDLTPLDDEVVPKHTLLSRGRMIGAGMAVVVLVAGAAFALKGGDDDNGGNDGVASLDNDGDSDSGDGGSGNSGNGDRPSQAEVEDAALKYAQCMRDHGVDMPDPEFSEDGGVAMRIGGPANKPGSQAEASAAQKKMEAADKACRHFMDDVAPQQDLSPEEIAEMQDKQVKLAECMRDKGYDFPDPVVDDEGRITSKAMPGGGPEKAPEEEDEFRKDMDDCIEEAGLDGPDGGPGLGSKADA